jgi:hypothetical protein
LLFYSGSELLNRALDLMDLRGTVEISGNRCE